MDFKRLFQRGKKVVDDRGGTAALKQDMNELRDIAKGEGSMKDKAKAAADALKDPGAKGADTPAAPPTPSPDPPGTTAQGDTPAGAR